ncbi:MAG: hypothetical protein Q4Q03_07895, partial [Bowdeniella nasicola]|nr:hypothetical protein [Bowdeniella nasicola]
MSNRDTLGCVITVEQLQSRVNTLFPQLLADLGELVKIPSISSPAFDQRELDNRAAAVAKLLEDLGMEVQTL